MTLRGLLDIAKVYSKSRKTEHPKGWVEDTAHKQNTATDEMKALAAQYMMASYQRLESKSAEQIALRANGGLLDCVARVRRQLRPVWWVCACLSFSA